MNTDGQQHEDPGNIQRLPFDCNRLVSRNMQRRDRRYEKDGAENEPNLEDGRAMLVIKDLWIVKQSVRRHNNRLVTKSQ